MERPALSAPRIPYLRLKVGILLVLVPLIVVGMVLYTLHARGVFEASRTVSLLAADADGVSTGMPVTFSGFPIGRVIRMSLQDDGRVHVEVRIPEKEARWLRTTSVFTLDQPIIGSAKIRVTTPDIAAPPLPAGATVELVKRDATAQLPQILERTDAVLANVEAMTGGDSSLRDTLASLQVLSRRMSGEFGALEGLTGSPERARQVLGTLERADALVASLRQTSRQLEQLTARADQRLFAAGGMADETRRSLTALNATLTDARGSLQKVDGILTEAQATVANARQATGNVATATQDLGVLRAEVDDSIARVNRLIAEINRRWPFAGNNDVKLP